MFKYLPAILLIFSCASWSGELKVRVENINKDGVLYMAVYNDKDVFESDTGESSQQRPGIVGGLIKAVSQGETEGIIELDEGTYAIGFYIDKNENEKLDTNFLGIPKEQFGFSNDVMGRFGPPTFEAASFAHKNETVLIMRAR